MHLAQVNLARLIAPLDDPRLADFVAQLDPVNRLAEQSPGFVWRLQSESGNATDVAWGDDPSILVNMSVWESVESLRAYVYASQHLEVFRDRRKWFTKLEDPHYCMWWVPAGHRPTIAEAKQRLELYRRVGPTQDAFWVSEAFGASAV